MPSQQRSLWRALHEPRGKFILLIVIWALGTAIVFLGATFGQYLFTNVDAVSYIDIAKQYAGGHVADALNAYWSPAISWSIIPFIWAGVDPVTAMIMVNAIAGCAAAALGTWFIWSRTQQNLFASIIFLGTALALALGTLLVITPDMLVVLWSVGFIMVFVWADKSFAVGTRKARIWAAIALGAMGAVGYFVKLFLLPFFAATVILWVVIRILIRRRAARVDNGDAARDAGSRHQTLQPLVFGAIALAAMVVVMAPWVTALTVKYHTPMVGSSFTVNVTEKFAPDAGVHAAGRGGNSLILESPPNKYATAYIEDPTLGIKTQQAESAKTGGSLVTRVGFYLHERLRAFPYYLTKFGSIAPFAVPIMALIALAMVFGVVRLRSYPSVTLILLSFGVYFSGYAAIVSVESGGGNHRYFWPMLLWATMAVSLVWPRFFERVSHGIRLARGRQVAAVLLVALIPAAALGQLVLNIPYPFSENPAQIGIGGYALHPFVQPPERAAAALLKKVGAIEPHDKLASNEFRLTRQYAFYDDAQIYGRDRPNDITDPAFQAVMASKGIQKYFYFYDPKTTPKDTSSAGTIIYTHNFNFTCPTLDHSTSLDCSLEVIKLKKP
jgi:hypothetical protein